VGRPVRAALLVALTLPFLVPLLRPGWIQSHEGLSYPIRLAQLARCWDDGFWCARWFPDLNFGQGYPFLCFYAPLVFGLSGLAHASGAPLDLALKVPVVVATLLGAAGAYRLVRTATGTPAALGAAALWTYAPYAVRDVYIRGDVAEYLAMAFLPWTGWALVRLAHRRGPADVALLAVAAALTILSHNVLGLLTGGMLVLATLAVMPGTERVRAFGTAAAIGGAAALLLTAFFWAPALREREFVRIDVLTSGHYVVARHFATAAQLLGRGESPGVGQALPMTFEIGWIGLATSLLAPLALRRRDPEGRRLLRLGALYLVAGIVMSTSLGAPIYRAVPLLAFVQFPWRFLSLVALGVAVLGGVGLEALGAGRTERWRRVLAAVVVAASVLLVRGILGPKSNPAVPSWAIDPDELRELPETTTRGEYVPRWAETDEPRGFASGVRGTATIVAATRRAGRWDLTVSAATPATIELVDSYYPGWTARVDGEATPVAPSERGGHVRIEVPAGRHEVLVTLEPTPFRRRAQMVSAVTCLGGFAILMARRRRPSA